MDTTPEYIEMCGMAWPDLYGYYLANHENLRPMFIYDFATERVSILVWTPRTLREKLKIEDDAIILSVEHGRDRGLWIPEGTRKITDPVIPLWRQDQLQEMVTKKNEPPESLISHIYYWIQGPCHHVSIPSKKTLKTWNDWSKYLCSLHSMEQLWLAFVMKELYGKQWNGQEWG